jgi:hypothetical protein
MRAHPLVRTGALVLVPAVLGASAGVEREVAVPAPGRVVVTLDAAVYEGARADLGDLRVVDAAGAEVPYLFERVDDEPLLPPQHPQISNRAFHRGEEAQATLDFGAPTLKSQLALSLSGDNFRRRVKVEGRARTDPQWATLTDSAYVFAVPGPWAARYETVALPENNFPLLRVTVYHGPDDPERTLILDASTRPAGRRRPREVTLVPRLTRTEDASAHETILTVDLGARHQPVRGVRLDVSDPAFFRGVIVEARIDPFPAGAGEAALPLSWRYLGEGAIYRYEEGGETREGLRLDVSGRERVLRLRVRNRDDRPLAIGGVTAFVPVERIAFEAREDKRVDKRSGVSQRLPISVLENAVSNAERRTAAAHEDRIVPRISDVYSAVPSITGKLELEYEGELQGGDTIARELIRRAAGKVLDERAGGADLVRIVAWFDQGGALKVPGDERSELCYKGFAVVPGLLELVEDVGLSPKSDHPRAVAACELVLEGLAAAKRISRSEELGYTRAKPERRDPGFGKGGISFG